MSKSKILFCLSGSIAAFKACQVISRLVQDGNEVQAVATESALKFVGAATLEGLTGKRVLTNLWEEGRAMDHIHLSRWADFGVLCPASANSCARMATGQADDIVSAITLAWPKDKPFHVFPAMNKEMLSAIPTQKNLATLTDRGFSVHETHAGNLACGEEGGGRLLEPEEILAKLKPARAGKILFTSGATREPIDGIRFVSNVSTGQTGAELVDRLVALGWQVSHLAGEGAKAAESVPPTRFTSYEDLDEKLRLALRSEDYDVVIHCAAVSDYSVDKVNGKAPRDGLKLSSADELSIQFKRNGKILPNLREYSRNKNITVVGFKLTLNDPTNLKQAAGLLGDSVDYVIANDWSQVREDRSKHPGRILSLRSMDFEFTTLPELALELDRRLRAHRSET